MVERWLQWAEAVIAHYDRKALDALADLRNGSNGHKLRARYGWNHTLTTDEALKAFLRPIEEIEGELETEDRAKGST